MAADFWFNRMVEHWSLPQRLDLVEHVRRARLQVVQAGTFGPMFYGLADDPEVERSWAGMPLVGVRENVAYAADLIPRLQEAGARVVGQMSMAWHYGDHETGKGLFGAWERIWTDDLLGPAPCAEASDALQRLGDGALRRWPIEGRPYFAYSGCMCNPHWLAMLKPMVRKAIELGVDGFNVHHNFEQFCACAHCQEHLQAHLQEIIAPRDLERMFGTGDLADVEDVRSPREECPADLKQRLTLAINRVTHLRRKEAFDEVFVAYGRSLNPDLLLAQWYHKYDFKPQDERSLLPDERWARGEDYIWYSQGSHKGVSYIEHGYLADMGLPARFIYAASGGKPFVTNKYDSKRWRLSIAEAAAHHGAALAYHWVQDSDATFALEDYYGPVIRYQRFLADHDTLLHPARPWSQVALVYPRRAEREGEMDCLAALKRIGRLLEDRHVLFDIILDEQLAERGPSYPAVILPEVKRLSLREETLLRRFVEKGGILVFTGDTGTCGLDGHAHPQPLLGEGRVSPPAGTYTARTPLGEGNILYIPRGPWEPDRVEVKEGVRLPLYPPLEKDPFGGAVLADLEHLMGGLYLETDAPWFVRVRAWLPTQQEALVLHWVNYQQDQDASVEVPFPVGPLQVECTVPADYQVEKVEWRYPERKTPVLLEHTTHGNRIRFVLPKLIVYGLSVLYLKRVQS